MIKNFFPLLRGCLLGTVAAWTMIVLGIAIHFQMSFVDSAAELTYVALAVFVAAVTLALFLVVLVAPCNKFASNILRTKWEVVWLGVLAILWTSLAGYTTTPAAHDNEVECWDEDENGNIVDANVDGSFAFFNCIIRMSPNLSHFFLISNIAPVLFLFLFVLVLALWHHSRGRFVIWTTRTTSVGWFDRPTSHGTSHKPHLPPPITQRKSHKDERYEKWDNEKEVGSGRRRHFEFGEKAAGKVGDKIRSISLGRRGGRAEDDREAKAELIQKPAAAAARKGGPAPAAGPPRPPAINRSNSAPLKPRQYVVGVPAGEGTKPALAPIAARMTEERRKTEDAPKRQVSQRERMDRERQAARKDRGDEEDEREGRRAYRGTGNVNDRSGSNAAGVAGRRDTSQARPDVVRSNSSANRPRRDGGESSGRDAQQSRNPYRQASGRRA
ncbi:hypothetical protein M408DRAFT_17393 [Serendipita vermifera MAFF 305830]|uniref:MARVEL domain-containing protein n=1 Tax=Serendipita vermifera MAFF 305830 TaxID=933852 RepID=A0A0C3AKZ5_SERVB|nr:hypothetical protein M408DRAFT_17393 [Serendipita vermifera MAFF 305830]